MRSIFRLTRHLIWVITGTLAVPSAAQVSPESWFAAGFAPFDQSAPVLAIEQGILSARESVRESLAESPFTLETRLAATGFQPNPDSRELASCSANWAISSDSWDPLTSVGCMSDLQSG